MKHAYLFLVVCCSLMASCGQGDTGRTAELQRQVDSLTKLVPAGRAGAKTSSLAANTQFSVAPTAASYWYVSDAANKQVQEWHATVKSGTKIDWNVNKGRTAFMVPAITLDTLINSLGCQYVVFYIGIDQQGSKEMSLFYTGVKQDGDNLSEIEMKNSEGEKCVFDLTYPCPQCDKIGVHVASSGIGGQPPVAIFASVENDNGAQHGTISPEGNKLYYNTTSAKYTFIADVGYTVGTVKFDTTIIQTNGKDHTFQNLSGSHVLSVKFTKQ